MGSVLREQRMVDQLFGLDLVVMYGYTVKLAGTREHGALLVGAKKHKEHADERCN